MFSRRENQSEAVSSFITLSQKSHRIPSAEIRGPRLLREEVNITLQEDIWDGLHRCSNTWKLQSDTILFINVP